MERIEGKGREVEGSVGGGGKVVYLFFLLLGVSFNFGYIFYYFLTSVSRSKIYGVFWFFL